MKKQKIYLSIALTALFIIAFSVSFVPSTSALVIPARCLTATYQVVANMQNITHSSSVYVGDAGSTFIADYSTTLSNVVFVLTKTGNPTGSHYAVLYEITGTSGTDGKPTGSVLATSGSIDASSVSGSAWVATTFYFSSSYPLVAGHSYGVAFVVGASASVSTSNYVQIAGLNSNVNSTMNCFLYQNGAWAAVNPASGDIYFIVNGGSEVPATPTPTGNPYQYWNGTHWIPYTLITPEPNIFENGTATPYIQMLVPVIILAVAALLGWKFAGAWGFFAGLNVGAILCYVILGSSVFPLWGIIALLVVDGLLLFGKVGIRS